MFSNRGETRRLCTCRPSAPGSRRSGTTLCHQDLTVRNSVEIPTLTDPWPGPRGKLQGRSPLICSILCDRADRPGLPGN